MTSRVAELIDPDVGRQIMEAAGAADVGVRLLAAAQSIASVEEVFAYSKAGEAPPRLLASASGLADCPSRVATYLERFHVEDPILGVLGASQPGFGLSRRVRAEDIQGRDYRSLCFDRPGFVDKLCFAWRRPGGWRLVSFYRTSERDGLEALRLAALANVALTSLAQNEAAALERQRPICDRLETRLERAFPSLPRRELQVCAATLSGVSAPALARRLGISVGSVLTYRQRAYRRLGVNQASDLLPRLLD